MEDRIAGVVVSLIDITERRRTEQALREQRGAAAPDLRERARVRHLLDGPGAPRQRLERRRRAHSWLARGRGARAPADIIFTPEERAERAPEREVETALATGRAADDRFHLRKDGSRFWASGVMTPMRDGAGRR